MEQRRVLLTGGSKGIGLGIARHLAAHGARVVTLQRTPAPEGAGFLSIPCDLEGPEEMIRGAVDRATALLGGIDRMVIAGGAGAYMGWRDWSPKRAESLMRTNYLGPRLVVHAALRELLRSARTAPARVLWIGSVIAERPGASGLEDYAATKAAAHAFLVSFARHYARLGIRATTLATGWVDTPMTQAIARENPELHAKILASIPLRRMATVEEVAEAAYSILEGPEFWTGEVVRFAAGGA